MGAIHADVRSIKDLPFSQFDIPPYQRPYKWSTENIIQLLNDIKDNLKKSEYRIGSIILHQHKQKTPIKYDLVDGQQRITSIILILKSLGIKHTGYNVVYPHIDSRTNIRMNYSTICSWIEKNLSSDKRKAYLDFLLNKCSVVFIVVDDVTEAFQMFDSQNGRGAELKAYNLLKAFHLRAIDKNSSTVSLTDEKVSYDRQWENNTGSNGKEDLIDTLTEMLYRIRLWSRRREAPSFDKTKIGEFKGIQVEDIEYPCQNFAKLLHYILYAQTKQPEISFVQPTRTKKSGPKALLQNINLPIINGAPFFEFIISQVENYKTLFLDDIIDDKLKQFRDDYSLYCLYPGCYGSGDTYVRNLYKALILAVYDKFGAEGVQQTYPTLYMLSYSLRLKYKQVRYVTVAQYPLDEFDIIQSSWKLRDLDRLERKARYDIGVRYYNNRVKTHILPFFIKQGVKVYAEESFQTDGITKGQIFNNDGKSE